MSPQLRQRIAQEAELIDRCSEFYHRKFRDLIDRLNSSADRADAAQSMRLCVEAVDMMLTTQSQIARALRELSRSQATGALRPRLRPAA